MSERLRDALAAHGPSGTVNSREGWVECECGERLHLPSGLTFDGYPEMWDEERKARDAHLESVVLAWLGERLGDAAVVEAVAEAVAVTFGGWHGPDPEGFGDDWTAEATAALAAVRALVTETSNEGDE